MNLKQEPFKESCLQAEMSLEGVTAKATQVYLVLVFVRYHASDYPNSLQSTVRFWTVRIVAQSHESAQIGAMNWAQMQKDIGIPDRCKAQAVSASTIQVLTDIDCIAASVKESS